MDYLIFSDESGCWNEGDYYIRSWVKISPVNYEALRKEIIFIKHETGIKELKWNSFKKNIEKVTYLLTPIQHIDYCVFITLSIPGHFRKRLDENKYTILKTLQEIPPEKSTGGEQITGIIKNKIISAAQHTIYYNFFESQHIKNAKTALIDDIPNGAYQFIIDSPQCLDKDWEKIANECGVKNVKIEKKSETNAGIELADIIAGCIHECLRKDSKALSFYNADIKKNMLNMHSRKIPNPNMIFYSDFSDIEKTAVGIIR